MRLYIFTAAFILAALAASGSHAIEKSLSGSTVVSADSTAADILDTKLKEYLSALDFEPRKIKCEEADFIIEACTDSITRQKTASTVYRHFLDSKIMGDEAVAIHIYDKWYATGKAIMESEAELWAAKLFATVNRQSLIGCQAPELQLEDIDGKAITIFSPETVGNGRYTILYFYDTECPKCRIESILLRNILENDNFAVNLYAIYTGNDIEKWHNYVMENLSIDTPATETTHFWSPDTDSGMDTRYGIIRTPGIFIVNPEGTIVGRGLDTYALEQILADMLVPKEIEYGSDEAMAMFRHAFSNIEKGMGCEGISLMAGHISDSILESQDTLLYKQMIGDLLYFVSGQRGENYKCGTGAFADKYILERGDVWNTTDDSLKVVSLARLMKNIAGMAPAGQKLPDIKVPATMASYKEKVKNRYATYSLGRMKNATVVFHSAGCSICRAEISAAYNALQSGKTCKVFLIDMDEIFSGKQETAEMLMENFDLSALPFILTTDSKACIVRKYISFL